MPRPRLSASRANRSGLRPRPSASRANRSGLRPRPIGPPAHRSPRSLPAGGTQISRSPVSLSRPFLPPPRRPSPRSRRPHPRPRPSAWCTAPAAAPSTSPASPNAATAARPCTDTYPICRHSTRNGGFCKHSGKLVFAALKENCHCETSPHTGRGNPPTFQTANVDGASVLRTSRKIRGIATSLRSSQ